MTTEPPKTRRRSFGFWAAVVIVTGGILYPLSSGPVTWLMRREMISFELFEKYLSGFDSVRNELPTPVHEALWWYQDLWEPKPEPQVNPHREEIEEIDLFELLGFGESELTDSKASDPR
jgi:hypothetical protein